MEGTDLTTGDAPYGYVNCFGGAPERLNGRLFYNPLQGSVLALETLRFASWRRFEACWPVCAQPRACAVTQECQRDRARTAAVWRARLARAMGV